MKQATALGAALAFFSAAIGALLVYVVVLWLRLDDAARGDANVGGLLVTTLVISGVLLIALPIAYGMGRRFRKQRARARK